jgi:ABC-type Na+ efflux pump permease subunit
MPFWNLVGFMVKAAIAFIPAAIILFILSVCVLSTFGTAFLSALLKSAR